MSRDAERSRRLRFGGTAQDRTAAKQSIDTDHATACGRAAVVAIEHELRRRRALREKAAIVDELRLLLLEHDRGDVDGGEFLWALAQLGNRASLLYVGPDGWRWAA